ncbi:hypothetical protein [Streptomyces sp. NPDC058612]
MSARGDSAVFAPVLFTARATGTARRRGGTGLVLTGPEKAAE